jgi:hypothetical protein
MFRDWSRLRSQSRVERGLSATGLTARKIHLHTGAAKHIDHRFTHFGEKTIHKACDEKLNGPHGFIVVQKLVV